MFWLFFLGFLSVVSSVAAGPTPKWENIRCEVTVFDCAQSVNSSREYIAGQCYASYSPQAGAAWMMSSDCSQVTVLSFGSSSAPRSTCSVAGGKVYSTITPTCVPGLGGTTSGARIYSTKKTVPAPTISSNTLCLAVVSQYTGSTTCDASKWSSTQVSPYARGVCISFTGTTGSSMSSSDCLSYSIYNTANCSGPSTSSQWRQGCLVDGSNSQVGMYGLPGSNAPPPGKGKWKPASGAPRGGWLSAGLVLSIVSLAIGFLC
eukprot:TRINITY_DN68141_c5_g10_i1.p1 TRINITY_DN68141_c5_g10~~TRINITY_DN68141_c5_g10_i1.p1  ORF type:complete len:261 (-),score=5.52 TRINITY_DN68141_c5_g10_i1:272-1054(-)